MDIIFFLAVAVYFFIRYRNILGTPSDGENRARPFSFADNENVVTLRPDEIKHSDGFNKVSLLQILKQMTVIDQSFSEKSFITGAKVAFKMIVEAFASGDKDTLKPLLSDDIYNDFVAIIDKREKNGETVHFTLHRIRDAMINSAALDGNKATIEVFFDSEQSQFIKDKNGKIIDGDSEHIIEIRDSWTFSRDLKSESPNWQLIDVQEENH